MGRHGFSHALPIANVGVAAANPVPPREAFEASKIGAALMHSLHTGSPVVFDEEGEPIMS